MQLPELEEYDFSLGDSAGTELSFFDPNLGNGNAQVRFELRPVTRQDYEIKLEVFRHIPSGKGIVTFALLLERVKISFFNASGGQVKTIVFDEVLGESGLFIIGDSSDGYFQRTVTAKDLGNARRVKIKLFGNYE
jgi:hypothetical protein